MSKSRHFHEDEDEPEVQEPVRRRSFNPRFHYLGHGRRCLAETFVEGLAVSAIGEDAGDASEKLSLKIRQYL